MYPPGSMDWIAAIARFLFSGVIFRDAALTETSVEYVTNDRRSLGPRTSTSLSAATRAWRIFSPDIEPERSITSATLSGTRASETKSRARILIDA